MMLPSERERARIATVLSTVLTPTVLAVVIDSLIGVCDNDDLTDREVQTGERLFADLRAENPEAAELAQTLG